MNLERLLDIMRVPRIHRGFRQEIIENDAHWKSYLGPFCEHMPEHLRQGHSFVFLGPYSCGKSATAAHLLTRALDYHKVGCWISMDEIAQITIEDSIFDHVTGKTLSEHIRTCPLLVIDEFFIRSGDLRYKEHATEMLVRRRVDDLRSTIITSNLSPGEIRKNFESFAAALDQQFKMIKFPSYDFRQDRQGRLK